MTLYMTSKKLFTATLQKMIAPFVRNRWQERMEGKMYFPFRVFSCALTRFYIIKLIKKLIQYIAKDKGLQT